MKNVAVIGFSDAELKYYFMYFFGLFFLMEQFLVTKVVIEPVNLHQNQRKF